MLSRIGRALQTLSYTKDFCCCICGLMAMSLHVLADRVILVVVARVVMWWTRDGMCGRTDHCSMFAVGNSMVGVDM